MWKKKIALTLSKYNIELFYNYILYRDQIQNSNGVLKIDLKLPLETLKYFFFLTFHACFLIPTIYSKMNSNFSNLSNVRNLQEQVKKAFYYQKLFWPFTVRKNCSSDFKNFLDHSKKKKNLTVVQNNFGNKIPLFTR